MLQTWQFEKVEVPDDAEGKSAIAQKLAEKYQVSLLEYARSLTVTVDERYVIYKIKTVSVELVLIVYLHGTWCIY